MTDFTFPTVNFPFISSNIPSAPVHGPYILQLIRYSTAWSRITMIFWTELSCWRKSCWIKTRLLPDLNHHCKNSTVVITNWLIAMKYHFLKWQWIFSILSKFFLSSITSKTFYWTWQWVSRGRCLIWNRNCL